MENIYIFSNINYFRNSQCCPNSSFYKCPIQYTISTTTTLNERLVCQFKVVYLYLLQINKYKFLWHGVNN